MKCSSNLKQIGLAAHNAPRHERLPATDVRPCADPGLPGCFTATDGLRPAPPKIFSFLLSFVEADNIFKAMTPTGYASGGMKVVPTYLCARPTRLFPGDEPDRDSGRRELGGQLTRGQPITFHRQQGRDTIS